MYMSTTSKYFQDEMPKIKPLPAKHRDLAMSGKEQTKLIAPFLTVDAYQRLPKDWENFKVSTKPALYKSNFRNVIMEYVPFGTVDNMNIYKGKNEDVPNQTGHGLDAINIDKSSLPHYWDAFAEEIKLNPILEAFLSLDYSTREEYRNEQKRKLVALLQRPPLYGRSPEAKIARMTLALQNMWKHFKKSPCDKVTKRKMLELVHKRRRYIEYVRRINLASYMNIIDVIGVHMVLPPMDMQKTPKVTRKMAMKFAIEHEAKADLKEYVDKRQAYITKRDDQQDDPVKDT